MTVWRTHRQRSTPPPTIDAASIIDACLDVMFGTIWPVLHDMQHRLRRVLGVSRCERATALRRYLSLVGADMRTATGPRQMDLDAFFTGVCTPQFMIALLEDVRATGALSPTDCACIEESVLKTVTAEGRWRMRSHGV